MDILAGFELISFVLGAIGGATIGSLITLRVTKSTRASHGGRNINQSNSRAGRDIVGGDLSSGPPRP